MIQPLDLSAVTRPIEAGSSDFFSSIALAMLVTKIGFKFIEKIRLASMPPLQRRRRIRRALISRIKHPSRSKFTGAQFCRRQGQGRSA